jgi:hypothetical protein
MDLRLELNASAGEVCDPSDGMTVMITPPIGEGYWWARVPVGGGQAIVAFPKFTTIGIGFQREEDWNANLPYSSPAEEIFDHIKHNRGDCEATRAQCIEAIRILQAWAKGVRPQGSERGGES